LWLIGSAIPVQLAFFTRERPIQSVLPPFLVRQDWVVPPHDFGQIRPLAFGQIPFSELPDDQYSFGDQV